jgi:hypothetical protein
MQQLFRLERLFDEIHRAAPDRRDGGVDIAVTGKDDDRQVGLALLDLVKHFKAVHGAAVEPHVEQHEAGARSSTMATASVLVPAVRQS